jgi:Mlc titration factor MtfA (ptsG expression regulator)
MPFPWQQDWEAIRTAPFPHAWREYLEANVPHYRYLSEWEQEALRGDLRVFMAQKHWEGCGGLTLTDEIRVTVSAQACLLTLCLPHNFYPNVLSIFVYPAAYAATVQRVGPAGVVTEGLEARLGEAWHSGPVVLSWQDAKEGALDAADGQNVVFHEFAHKLDIMDGAADGYPRLHDDAAYSRWHEAMKEEWERLRRESERGHATLLDRYGATNAAELFAVATEAFFEKPRQMREGHERLYEVLKEYFRQDPAARLERPPLPENGQGDQETPPVK